MVRSHLLAGLALLLPACSKEVDARARTEIRELLDELVQSATSLDVRGFAKRFRGGCPFTIHFQGKTKRTTVEPYCRELEENLEKIEKNEVELLEVQVEEQEGGGYRVRTRAREVSVVAGRTLWGEVKNCYGIERAAEGLEVVSYESWITVTRVRDPQAGEFDPRDRPGSVSWDDPLAR